MKINLPVTGQERLFTAEKSMVTKTNTKGLITFANQDFLDITGFSEAELMGANHNIIRHPDMPAVAFEIMWKTLKRGLPWQGVVKNRCKNGDHYWVDARVVPIKKRGQVTGYMSVRTCPSREAVASAQAAYQAAATAPETLQANFAPDWKKHLSIKNGIPLWILFVTLMMIGGGILGITGLKMSQSDITALYYDDMAPVQSIGRINFLMADNRAQMILSQDHQPGESADAQQARDLNGHLQTMLKNKGEIDQLWGSYATQIRDATEKGLADQYAVARGRYVQEGLLQAKQAFENHDFLLAEQILKTKVNPLYDEANARVSVLLRYLSERGQTKITETTQRSRIVINLAMAGITLSCLVLVVAGIFFFRVTAKPLEKAVQALEEIAEGNLSGQVDAFGYGEPGRVIAAVSSTQMQLKVMMHEIQQSSDSIHAQCRNLNHIMMNLAEQSDEQHDRVYQTVDAVTQSRTAMQAIASNMETLMHAVDAGGAPGPAPSRGLEPETPAFELIPPELQALFGDALEPPAASVAAAQAPGPELADEALPPVLVSDVSQQVQAMTSAARLQSAAEDGVAAQLNQVAELIVRNRADAQGAWAASQQLQKTARELEQLVQYFE